MDISALMAIVMLVTTIFLFMLGKLIDISSENKSRKQALEVCADLCPSLLEVFGTDSVNKKISLKKVSEYLKAKEATSTASSQRAQVEQIERLFR